VVWMKLPRRAVLGNQDHVPAGWNPAVQSQPLAQQALDPVSNDCVPHFLGDGQTEPTAEARIRASFGDREHVSSVQLEAADLNRKVLGSLSGPPVLGDGRPRAAPL